MCSDEEDRGKKLLGARSEKCQHLHLLAAAAAIATC